jgi:hypothetical protein
LTAEKWPRLAGGLAAGDRLPDAPLLNPANGSRTTLFAALRDGKHSLLLLPGSHNAEATAQLAGIAEAVERSFPNVTSPHIIWKAAPAIKTTLPFPAWFDAEGKLHQQLGAAGNTLLLIRPEGYIGYRCQPADGEALVKHMGTYLIRKN